MDFGDVCCLLFVLIISLLPAGMYAWYCLGGGTQYLIYSAAIAGEYVHECAGQTSIAHGGLHFIYMADRDPTPKFYEYTLTAVNSNDLLSLVAENTWQCRSAAVDSFPIIDYPVDISNMRGDFIFVSVVYALFQLAMLATVIGLASACWRNHRMQYTEIS